jgi:hypothetical protein
MRSTACLLAAAILVFPAAAASAEPPAAAAAQDRFRQGREAFKQGHYQKALEHFRKSRELYPVPGTLLNLASCEEKLGLVASARQHFTEAASQLPERDARKILARKAMTQLEPRVPHLRIEVVPRIAAVATVTLDGKTVAPSSLGGALPVDPGPHVVLVKAPGMPEQRHDVVLEEGKQVDLVVGRAGESASNAARPPGGGNADTNGKRAAGIVIGGIGIATLGGGSAISMAAVNDSSRTGEALSWVGILTLTAGATGVGAGIYLMATSEDDSQAAKPTARVGFTPVPGGGTLDVRGSF